MKIGTPFLSEQLDIIFEKCQEDNEVDGEDNLITNFRTVE